MSHKRKIDILVLSDIHLGTYGCKANELLQYLKSISPKRVILNGDIIDMWQFKKRYWPISHTKVLKHLFKWMSRGIPVDYITGNHDEALRRYAGFKLGSFNIVNKKILKLDDKKAWIFHGDVFDVTMKFSPWLAKLGAIGYDFLIITNNLINHISLLLGKERLSLSKKVKDNVKQALKYISRFEETAVEIASKNQYDYVVCGHIHKPEIREFHTPNGEVTYLNSGDWIENLSSLEYVKGRWSIYTYDKSAFLQIENTLVEEEKDLSEKSLKELFGSLVDDILNNN